MHHYVIRRGGFAAVFILLLPASFAWSYQSPLLNTVVTLGHSPVGFHREWIDDPSRVWESKSAGDIPEGTVSRPLRIDVWYPADVKKGLQKMRVRDYLHASPPDSHHAVANRLIQTWDENSYKGWARATHIAVDSILNLQSESWGDAQVKSGVYPLIIYSGGWYNRSPDNIVMAEYLASRGYVVAEVPLFGLGLSTGDLSSSAAAVETQVRDVETALGALIAHPWIDRSRIASAGYSVGGVVALLLGSRNPLVKGVIGLDPSYGPNPEIAYRSPDFGLNKTKRPLLTLRSGHETYLNIPRSELIDSIQFADRYTADVGKGTHADFGDDITVEHALSLVPEEPRSTAEGCRVYQANLWAIEKFLIGVLDGDKSAMDSLANPGNTTLRMSHAPPAAIPSTVEWCAMLRGKSAEQVAKHVDVLKKRYPRLQIVIERDLNKEGYRLLGINQIGDAVNVLKFNALTHPLSANVYDSFADALEAANDRVGVIAAYKKLLVTLPGDLTIPEDVKTRMRAHAVERLNAFGATER